MGTTAADPPLFMCRWFFLSIRLEFYGFMLGFFWEKDFRDLHIYLGFIDIEINIEYMDPADVRFFKEEIQRYKDREKKE